MDDKKSRAVVLFKLLGAFTAGEKVPYDGHVLYIVYTEERPAYLAGLLVCVAPGRDNYGSGRITKKGKQLVGRL